LLTPQIKAPMAATTTPAGQSMMAAREHPTCRYSKTIGSAMMFLDNCVKAQRRLCRTINSGFRLPIPRRADRNPRVCATDGRRAGRRHQHRPSRAPAPVTEGRVTLHNHFDADKADIKPESEPVLSMLKTDPKLRLSIEGHTDNVGTAASHW